MTPLEGARTPAGAARDAGAADDPSDRIPLVILPDGFDLDSLAEGEPADPRRDEEILLEVVAEEVEEELEEELSAGAGGLRRLFAMPKVCGVLSGIAVALMLLLFVIGHDYYTRPASLRPMHHFHSLLRPSGYIGLPLGILGTGLILASLVYIARKHIVPLSRNRFGPLRSWMGFHIFSGLIGPLLIVFHAALVPQSAIGSLAFCGMLVVVLSGILGRYIYVHFPRALEGRDLELDDIRRRVQVYRAKLLEMRIDPVLLGIEEPAAGKKRSPWLLEAVIRVIYGDRRSRRELARLSEAAGARAVPGAQSDRLLVLVRRLCRERQWLVRYREFRKIMGAWRFLHRWLAIVLLAGILFHVLIAVRFGGLWILGGR